MMLIEPWQRDLVLVGGGHANIQVLKKFAMRPVEGVRLTLISDVNDAPYSGMLPGLLAGHYQHADVHFDLPAIAAKAGARFIKGRVTAIDRERQEIAVSGRPALHYDLAAINVGIVPQVPSWTISGAQQPTRNTRHIPLKPISHLLERWQTFQAWLEQTVTTPRVAVVGGGAAGVEIGSILQRQLARRDQAARVTLFQRDATVLPGCHARVSGRVEQQLAALGLDLRCGAGLEFSAEGELRSQNEAQDFDVVFWATAARAPEWMQASALPCNEHGFLQVNEQLQVLNAPDLYAAGDCVALPQARPKAGVYAVRAGPVLARNLRHKLTGRSRPQVYRPQRKALALVTLGDKTTLATRGERALIGAWLWPLKDHIDRKFMRVWQDYRKLERAQLKGGMPTDRLEGVPATDPLCGGCGAKVSALTLEAALAELRTQAAGSSESPVELSQPDDCSVRAIAGPQLLVETVDYVRAFVHDQQTMAAIATVHGLTDIHAMGAQVDTVQALVTLRRSRPAIAENDLRLATAGILAALQSCGGRLVGGHTTFGAEESFGVAAAGTPVGPKPWSKRGAQAGDVLLLTKALGTGCIMAAAMRGAAQAQYLDAALQHMQQGHGALMDQANSLAAPHACTDVTGFGLAGHLLEMLLPDRLSAKLDLAALARLPGADGALAQGYASTLHGENSVRALPYCAGQAADPILFDPQTSGGLLLALPAEAAAAWLAACQRHGLRQAAVIGQVLASQNTTISF